MFRDTCMKCGKTAEANGRALDFAHIIPRYICKCPEHLENLLLSLCVECHIKMEREQLHFVIDWMNKK